MGSGTDVESLLLDRYHVPKDVLGAILSDYYQCPYLPFDERTVIDTDLVRPLNHDYLKKHLWLPVARRAQLLDVLTHDPHDLEQGWDVRRTFPGMTIRYSVGLRRDVEQFLGALSAPGGGSAIGTLLTELVEELPPESVPDLSPGPVDENDSLIVRLTSHLITEADRLGASDLHLEHRIRLRHWAEPLQLPPHRLSLHVIESLRAESALLDFAERNSVDLIVLGAPSPTQHALAWWRSVASGVTANARCSVFVVRIPEL